MRLFDELQQLHRTVKSLQDRVVSLEAENHNQAVRDVRMVKVKVKVKVKKKYPALSAAKKGAIFSAESAATFPRNAKTT